MPDARTDDTRQITQIQCFCPVGGQVGSTIARLDLAARRTHDFKADGFLARPVGSFCGFYLVRPLVLPAILLAAFILH